MTFDPKWRSALTTRAMCQTGKGLRYIFCIMHPNQCLLSCFNTGFKILKFKLYTYFLQLCHSLCIHSFVFLTISLSCVPWSIGVWSSAISMYWFLAWSLRSVKEDSFNISRRLIKTIWHNNLKSVHTPLYYALWQVELFELLSLH